MPLVVLLTLAVHPAGRFEHILWMQAVQGSGFEDLLHGVLRDHHPLRRVRDRQRLAQRPAVNPDYPTPRLRTGKEPQILYLLTNLGPLKHLRLPEAANRKYF